MGDIAQRGNRLTRGKKNLLEELGRVEGERSNRNRRAEISRVHGELNRGYAKGGVVRRAKKFKTHGKDVPTMAAEGGRIGLKKGKMPWGTGPKPGTHEFLEHHLHKPRKGKAIGSIVKGGKKIVKKIIDKIKKKKRHESLDIPGSPGPEIGKYPGIDKAMSNIKKSGDIWGPGKAAGGRIDPKHQPKPRPKWSPKGQGWKPRQWPQQKPPQLRKSQKERREELRKKARKSGGHSKIIFADEWKHIDPGLQEGLFKKEGGRIGFRKGGTDKKWMQKVSASIKKRGTKGKCTPITKPGCTGRAKALAKTFKKIAAKRKA